MASLRVHGEPLTVRTTGKGTYEITEEIRGVMTRSGIATVFVQHTSCSLILMENADPTARADLEKYFNRLVPENEPYFEHNDEGPDDMPSHIRMLLGDYHPMKAFGAAILRERSRLRAVGEGSADVRIGKFLARCQAEGGRARSGPPRLTSSEPF